MITEDAVESGLTGFVPIKAIRVKGISGEKKRISLAMDCRISHLFKQFKGVSQNILSI
jgi:hypothetical protein